jgi:hypothetical protein
MKTNGIWENKADKCEVRMEDLVATVSDVLELINGSKIKVSSHCLSTYTKNKNKYKHIKTKENC